MYIRTQRALAVGVSGMMDEDYVEKKLYGNNIYDEDYDADCRNMEDYKRISFVMIQNKDAFMKLFSLFYYDLWD